MKSFAATASIALVLMLSAPCDAARFGDVHPVQKVINLLQGLSAKVEHEGKQEALLYEKFAHWCRNSLKTVSKAIQEEEETIDMLTSEIEAKEKQESTLSKQIAQLGDQIAALNAAGNKADEVRGEEQALYVKRSTDHNSTIQAIAAAIKELEAARDPGATLAQVLDRPRVRGALALGKALAADGAQRRALSALLQQSGRPVLKARGDLDAHVQKYDFKSNDVIELLKSLQARFEGEMLEYVKAETNAINTHDLTKQARDAEVEAAEDSKSEKETALDTVREDLSTLRGNKEAEEEDLAADKLTQATTEKNCGVKEREWQDRSTVRAKEREAMGAAVEILAKAAGVRTEAPSNPVPPASPVSLLQLAEDPRDRAVNLLRKAARVSHSKALSRLAEELSSLRFEAFDQVINSIEKMIFRLMDEQKNEDNHKDWCDQEISKSNISEGDKTSKIDKLRVAIEKNKGIMAQLQIAIGDAEDMVSDITSFVKDATEIRQVGKKENAEAVKDAQEAQDAIAEATAVIEAFYKDTGMIAKQSWELLQQPVDLPEEPSTWDASYNGVADPMNQPSGIVTILKEIGKDFASMEAQTRAQEAQDQDSYEEQMKASAIEKARRKKEVEVKEAEEKRLADKVAEQEKSKKHYKGELEAVQQYLKDLQPACVLGDSTYAERKAARKQEMDALAQAQDILTNAMKPKNGTLLAVKAAQRKLRAGAVLEPR